MVYRDNTLKCIFAVIRGKAATDNFDRYRYIGKNVSFKLFKTVSYLVATSFDAVQNKHVPTNGRKTKNAAR